MNSDFVLKHVAKQPLLICADYRATTVVVVLSVILLFKSSPIIAITTFACCQLLAIGLTQKDPFFVNVFKASGKKATINRQGSLRGKNCYEE